MSSCRRGTDHHTRVRQDHSTVDEIRTLIPQEFNQQYRDGTLPVFDVVVSTFGYFRIELSGRILAVLLIAEVIIVLILDAVVVFSGGGPEGYSTGIVDPTQIVSGAPGFAVLFAILSFIGFEGTAVFRDEAKNPERTIPRATYIALILIGAFYTLSSWVLISANGQSTIVAKAGKNAGTILATTTNHYLGAAGEHIIQVLFATSLFACILSFHSFVTRYFFSLSSKGVLPARLSQPHGPTRGWRPNQVRCWSSTARSIRVSSRTEPPAISATASACGRMAWWPSPSRATGSASAASRGCSGTR